MQRLYQFYFLFKEYIIFSALVLISIALLAENDNDQIRRIRSLTVGAIGALQGTFSVVPNIFVLQRENELLRRMNVNLADEVNQLREAKLENMRLRSMIALKESTTTPLTAGKVIAKNLNLLRNTVTLNIGADDGVVAGMPIVTGEGLVGRVIATSGGYSIGEVMVNVDFRASAKDQRSRVDGIIAWDGKSVILKNIAKSLDVRPGDAIVTSEYSDVFPSGIKIGVVSAVTEIPGSLFKKVEVEPAVDFVKLEEAFVIHFLPNLEKLRLEEKTQK
ncbi:MAG TPA: rod shape-determining protein MreC [Bacteroidota bacterium]|nr:rod shape-determining protein MreC [Bacteroidota bacterium]